MFCQPLFIARREIIEGLFQSIPHGKNVACFPHHLGGCLGIVEDARKPQIQAPEVARKDGLLNQLRVCAALYFQVLLNLAQHQQYQLFALA